MHPHVPPPSSRNKTLSTVQTEVHFPLFLSLLSLRVMTLLNFELVILFFFFMYFYFRSLNKICSAVLHFKTVYKWDCTVSILQLAFFVPSMWESSTSLNEAWIHSFLWLCCIPLYEDVNAYSFGLLLDCFWFCFHEQSCTSCFCTLISLRYVPGAELLGEMIHPSAVSLALVKISKTIMPMYRLCGNLGILIMPCYLRYVTLSDLFNFVSSIVK